MLQANKVFFKLLKIIVKKYSSTCWCMTLFNILRASWWISLLICCMNIWWRTRIILISCGWWSTRIKYSIWWIILWNWTIKTSFIDNFINQLKKLTVKNEIKLICCRLLMEDKKVVFFSHKNMKQRNYCLPIISP